MKKKENKKNRHLKIGVVKFLYNTIFILNILFILGLVCYYSYRLVYYYNKENHKSDQSVDTLVKFITDEANIVYAGDGLYNDNDGYRFKGKDVKNYVYYSGLLWRIIKVNEDKTITMISEENLTSLAFGYENNSYKDSYIKQWLNNQENMQNTGILYNKLNNADMLLVNTKTCVDILEKATKTECKEEYDKESIGLISVYDYLEAGGKESYLNTSSYFWTSNMSKDHKVWYVFDKGGLNNISSVGDTYHSYGVRPVITLNSEIGYISGDGTKDKPYVIENYNFNTLSDSLIGQYLTFNGYNFRVIDKNESGIKIIMNDVIKENGQNVEKVFSLRETTFNPNVYNNIGYYLNRQFYSSINNKDYLVTSTFYNGRYSSDTNFDYKQAMENDISANIALPQVGDLFLTDIKNNYTMTNGNEYEESVVSINEDGDIHFDMPDTKRNIRPVLYLRKDIKIIDGKGTLDAPFIIE